MAKDPHPGMMGDGTEEQNLGQVGHPEDRVTFSDAEAAFSGQSPQEPRSFDAKSLGANLKERGAAVRERVADTADVVRDWAVDQAAAAKKTASEKPVLVVSVSAATALAVGLALGFVLGRASND